MIPFNQKKHSDITVTISEGDCLTDESRTFFLHKFPLISKSVYFDQHIVSMIKRLRVRMALDLIFVDVVH